MRFRPVRWCGRLLALVGLTFLLLAPTAALAQDYPSPPPSSTPCQNCSVTPGGSSSTSGTGLAFTGGNIALLVGVGLIAVAGGFVLVRLGRRTAVAR